MPSIIRILRLLSIVVWVGGIIFFAFVLAPVAFHVLPLQRMAGMVVNGTLRIFDLVGIVCGCIFCAASALHFLEPDSSRKGGYEVQILLALLMLTATGYLHTGILPAMERDRIQAGNDIQLAPADNPSRLHFEMLHKHSERLEGAVLLCGLAIVVLMARESLPATS